MMWEDPIVEEVRRIRAEILAEHNGDLAALCQDLRERTERGEFSDFRIVRLPPKPARRRGNSGTRRDQNPRSGIVAKTMEELEGEVLSLPDDARARLAQKLLASLDDEDDVESAWYDEAERRIAEYEASGEEPMSIEAFLAELRAERR